MNPFKDSLLEPEEYTRMIRKLNRIGGIYIYNDGIRVLPYGNADYDFLGVEKRRTLSAAYYYFSFRRMIGIIELTRNDNENLKEKAGREGFRENTAYKQLSEILEEFLIQTAADFFREGGVKSDPWKEKREELNIIEVARRRKEKQSGVKKKKFSEELDRYFNSLENANPHNQIAELEKDVRRRLENLQNVVNPLEYIIDTEEYVYSEFSRIESEFSVKRPKGVGFSKKQNSEWKAYVNSSKNLKDELFAPVRKRLDISIGHLAKEANIELDLRKRFEKSLNRQAKIALKDVKESSNEIRDAANVLRQNIVEITRDSIKHVDTTIREVSQELQALDFEGLSDEEIVDKKTELESRVDEAFEKRQEQLENIRQQLLAVNIFPDESGRIIGINETNEALEEELVALKEDAETNLELIQLGMAVGIINHEFHATANAVRKSLRTLSSWANVNKNLFPLYQDIRNSFDHLDGYLTLFTPFTRRLKRRPMKIKEKDIIIFLEDLFSERIRRHNIKLKPTAAFKKAEMTGYASTFYPVYVNLVDNAIYWLKDQNGERQIELDYIDGVFIVSDTGPGVPIQARDLIFDKGYTRKAGGRGLGLFISREVLKADPNYPYDLILSTNSETGAVFKIIPRKIEEKENDN
ncbi:MAG: ATP-binding protein [Candidatus Hatepunaea meridiana]|nr:ATP-binding protein [Candidatus Hatepunaea meridiana]